MPSRFKDAIEFVCKETFEEIGSDRFTRGRVKDRGVDVIAWIPFADDRPGQVVLLIQCAIGKDWDKKAGDIKIPQWDDMIRWKACPIIAVAFPFVCLDQNKWKMTSHTYRCILFDRLRLTAILSIELGSPLGRQIQGWISDQSKKLPHQ